MANSIMAQRTLTSQWRIRMVVDKNSGAYIREQLLRVPRIDRSDVLSPGLAPCRTAFTLVGTPDLVTFLTIGSSAGIQGQACPRSPRTGRPLLMSGTVRMTHSQWLVYSGSLII